MNWGKTAFQLNYDKTTGEYEIVEIPIIVKRKYVYEANPMRGWGTKYDIETGWEVRDWGDKKHIHPTIELVKREIYLREVLPYLSMSGGDLAKKMPMEQLRKLYVLLFQQKEENK